VTPRRLNAIERLPQAIAEQVVRRIVEIIDIDEIVRKVDVDDIVRRVDVNALVERVDANALVERVDVDAIVERVDANALMDRVDIDRIVDRIDINSIAERIDVEAIAERIDVDALVRRADLGPIIAQSTSGMLGEFLGLLRRQVVSLDALLDRVALYHRRFKDAPKRPRALEGAEGNLGASTREGEYAGGVTRLLAFFADIFAIWGIFVIFGAGVTAAARLFTGKDVTLFSHRPGGLIAITIWAFIYFTFQWSVSGRTIGMAIFGIRVVTLDGESISTKQAAIRTVVLPLSVVLWFIFLVGIELRANRNTLHDRLAGTTVVYFWEARGATMGWLQPDN